MSPSRMLFCELARLRADLIACTDALVSEGDPAPASVEATRIRGLMMAQNASIQGNRRDAVRMTWADARLQLAATLRQCLEELEG